LNKQRVGYQVVLVVVKKRAVFILLSSDRVELTLDMSYDSAAVVVLQVVHIEFQILNSRFPIPDITEN
jgi:hypothetical protein